MTTVCYSDIDQLFLLPGPNHKMTPIFFSMNWSWQDWELQLVLAQITKDLSTVHEASLWNPEEAPRQIWCCPKVGTVACPLIAVTSDYSLPLLNGRNNLCVATNSAKTSTHVWLETTAWSTIPKSKATLEHCQEWSFHFFQSLVLR